VAALLSLLINTHGQKGIVILTDVELIQVVLEDVKNQEAKTREEEVAANSRNIQVAILQ